MLPSLATGMHDVPPTDTGSYHALTNRYSFPIYAGCRNSSPSRRTGSMRSIRSSGRPGLLHRRLLRPQRRPGTPLLLSGALQAQRQLPQRPLLLLREAWMPSTSSRDLGPLHRHRRRNLRQSLRRRKQLRLHPQRGQPRQTTSTCSPVEGVLSQRLRSQAPPRSLRRRPSRLLRQPPRPRLRTLTSSRVGPLELHLPLLPRLPRTSRRSTTWTRWGTSAAAR